MEHPWHLGIWDFSALNEMEFECKTKKLVSQLKKVNPNPDLFFFFPFFSFISSAPASLHIIEIHMQRFHQWLISSCDSNWALAAEK